ncbi:MAG: hypothetical protein QNJ13_08590 [Paracoccaceae bacterium]|nr:hypothetical protein [Paracoccaceae bacterium]
MGDTSKKQPELKLSKADDAPHRIADPKMVNKGLGLSPEIRLGSRIAELQRLLWLPEGMSEEDKHLRLARAIELYEGLEPRDTGEAMLAQQMVGTHEAAMECLRRAMLPNQTFEGRNMALKHAAQLMALYEKQFRTLQKSKGKGQQKVTVEHVHVEAGGQAIVGNVEAGSSSVASRNASPAPEASDPGSASQDPIAAAEIEQASDQTIDLSQKTRAKTRRR